MILNRQAFSLYPLNKPSVHRMKSIQQMARYQIARLDSSLMIFGFLRPVCERLAGALVLPEESLDEIDRTEACSEVWTELVRFEMLSRCR